MTELYIIFGLAMIINVAVIYLSLGIVLAEYKDIYLPFINKIVIKGEDI